MTKVVCAVIGGGALALVLTGASTAWADVETQTLDKTQCTSAYDQGQRAKLHGELLRARAELAICAQAACPALQPECVRWLDEVNQAMPSIVVQARGSDGNDKTHVRVFADGKLLTDHLDGNPIELDPGEHGLRFEAAGENLPDQHFLLTVGQKARPVVSAAKVASLETSSGHDTRPMPIAGWINGGIGVVALGTFGVFAAMGANDYGHLPSCKCGSASDWDRTEFIVADVALGAAVVALAVTAIIFFTRPTKTAPGRVGLQF